MQQTWFQINFLQIIFLNLYLIFTSMTNIDDAGKSTVSYTANTQSQRHLHNTKREDLTESTGVVPAKYPLKVKLELLTTLEC